MNQPSGPTKQRSTSSSITLVVYRDLRVGLAVVMLMFAAAIIIDAVPKWCVQGALSEYFYTPAHSIFIATLIGFGTLFFVYRGSSDTEDALLTLAGVAALIAALVPQGRPELCTPSFVPEGFKTEVIVRPNVWAVVVALLLGWAVTWWKNRYNRPDHARSAGGTLALYFLRLVVAGGLLCLIFKKDWFLIHAHGAAGVLMLSAFIATVFTTAHLAKKEVRSTGPDRLSGVLHVDRPVDACDVNCCCRTAYHASPLVSISLDHRSRSAADPGVPCILVGSNRRVVGYT